MQIKDAVGLGSGVLSGEKLTESRDTTLQLPNTTPKAETAKMHSYRAKREMLWCGASRSVNLHPMAEGGIAIAIWGKLFCKCRLFVCLTER